MQVNYWADTRPRKRRTATHKLTTIPSPFALENRQFYASVDAAFDAGPVEVSPGIFVDRDMTGDSMVAVSPGRNADIEAEREF